MGEKLNKVEADATVVSVNISAGRGGIKRPVQHIVLDGFGIVGDAHRGRWHRQVSILMQKSIRKFADCIGRTFSPGEFAENIIISELDAAQVAILDRFSIGTAEIEVTQIGKECHDDKCSVYQNVGRCIMSDDGIFCRVIKGGTVKPGDKATLRQYIFTIKIITVSDRTARGESEDISGPRIRNMLQKYFDDRRWHIEIKKSIVPDDEQMLHQELQTALQINTDVIITTGGTGIGQRDITPDVIEPMCRKKIPGIMEHIRTKYGAKNPNALLSRSIAGVAGKTIIFALPGSTKAVSEYMTEILKILEHTIFMIHEIDVHRH